MIISARGRLAVIINYLSINKRNLDSPHIFISTGIDTSYSAINDELLFKLESLQGMSGGGIGCSLLPSNVLAGIGKGNLYESWKEQKQEEKCTNAQAQGFRT